MPPDLSSPHDALFRKILATPASAASELKIALPPEIVALIDWDTLERVDGAYVSGNLDCRHSDLVFRARLVGQDREVHLHALLEHQSRPDPLMAFRMLDYFVGFVNNHLQAKPKSKTIPAVIPIVVHVGPRRRRWNAPLELHDLYDLEPDIRAALGDYLPRLRYRLDDINALNVSALLERPLTPEALLVLYLERFTGGSSDLLATLAPVMWAFQIIARAPGGLDPLRSFSTYLWCAGKMSSAEMGQFADRFPPDAKEVIMTTAEMLRAEGRAEGEVRGRTATLLKLFALKFGPVSEAVERAVRAAGVDQLDVWTERILTAASIEEVLA